MKKKDYFGILGLKPGATDKEIRSAYKRLAKKHHPDVNPGDKQAEDRFKEISEAYDVLTDPDKRRKWESEDVDFDSFYRNARGAGGGRGAGPDPFSSFRSGGASTDFGSIFDELLGGAGAQGGGWQPSPGDDLQYEASISFEEAVKGTTMGIPLAHTVRCPTCHGEGFLPSKSKKSCSRCGGSGRVTSGSG